MSSLPGDIGPLSVRYAAQIRALLQSQALERVAAEQEAARTAAHSREAERVKPVKHAMKVDAEVQRPVDKKPAPTETQDQPKTGGAAKIIDIQV